MDKLLSDSTKSEISNKVLDIHILAPLARGSSREVGELGILPCLTTSNFGIAIYSLHAGRALMDEYALPLV